MNRSYSNARKRRKANRQRGLSMIELMVGMLVSLLVLFAVVSTVSTLSVQRRNTVGGNDAKMSGQSALDRLEFAGRMAGTGLFHNGQLLCSTINVYYNGTVISNGGLLTPVKITDGGATGSDKITFTYGNAVGGNSISNVVDNMPNASAVYTVSNKGSLADGDLAIIGVPGSARPCTLFQVTAFPPGGGSCNGISSSCLNIQHNSGVTAPYNPPNPNTTWTDAPTYGFETSGSVIGPAVISRLGTLKMDTYEVLCNSLVSHVSHLTASCTSSPLAFTNATPLVGNVVQMKLQYGVAASPATNVVSSWVSATGSWATPSAANMALVKAIRVVVVSRSLESAPTDVTAPCTNAAGVANTGPCSFQDADSPVINLSAVPVPTGTWRNYRYRVYQSVIPLRNVIWNS